MAGNDAARARVYRGLFDGSNEAEREFLRVLPLATARVNKTLAAKGYSFRLTQAEVAINFITEGGFVVLDGNYNTVWAYGDLGVDDYMGMRKVYRKWVPPSVDRLADDPRNVECQNNEKRRRVCTLAGLSIEQAIELNAGVFAYHAGIASRDIEAYEKLPITVRFFWATMYYNAGIAGAREILKKHGVEYYKKGWHGPANNRVARFNAIWRMRSLGLFVEQLPMYNSAPESVQP